MCIGTRCMWMSHVVHKHMGHVACASHHMHIAGLGSVERVSNVFIYLLWISHVTYEWGVSHMNESCHAWLGYVTYHLSKGLVVSIGWVSWIDVKSIHESLASVDRVNGLRQMSLAKPIRESCHVWMSHVTCELVVSHMNESCHIWVSHVTHEWVMSRIKKGLVVLLKWVIRHP